MMDPSPDTALAPALDALLDRLEGEGMRLRVGSLVITFFGDAVANRGGAIRLSAIQEITERLRLEPGALRTAMSRLARDGWLTRQRQGRGSYYALTPHRLAETEAAAARIYAPVAPARPAAWTLAFSPGGGAAQGLRDLGFGALEGGGWLGPAEALPAAAALPGVSAFCAPGADAHLARGLVGTAWGAEDASARMQTMLRLLTPFDVALGGAIQADLAATTPDLRRDATAARCLAIHLWRRAALRAPIPAAELAPDGWPGDAARAMAARLYARLSPGAEAWLDTCDGAPAGAMTPRACGARFGA
jgi:phenylacetic acid degradation operon negative regulatory protein